MRKLCWFLLAMTFALAACNTVQGVGKDIKKAGDKIEDAAS
jgi:predicted small secreted protein